MEDEQTPEEAALRSVLINRMEKAKEAKAEQEARSEREVGSEREAEPEREYVAIRTKSKNDEKLPSLKTVWRAKLDSMGDDTTPEEAAMRARLIDRLRSLSKESGDTDNCEDPPPLPMDSMNDDVSEENSIRERLVNNHRLRSASSESGNEKPDSEKSKTDKFKTYEEERSASPWVPVEVGTGVESDLRAKLIGRLRSGSLHEKVSAEPIDLTKLLETEDFSKSKTKDKKEKKSKKDKKEKKDKKDKKARKEKEPIGPVPEFIDGIYCEDRRKEERFFRDGCIKYGAVAKFDKYDRLDLLLNVKKKVKPMRYFGKRAQRMMGKGVKFELQTSRIAEAVIQRRLEEGRPAEPEEVESASFLKFEEYIPPKDTHTEITKYLKSKIEKSFLKESSLERAWLDLVEFQDEICARDPATLPPEQKLTKQLTMLDRALEQLPNNLKLEICQAELYEMHYLFSSGNVQLKGWEAGLTSFEFFRRLTFDSEQRDFAPPKLFAKMLLAHLANPHFSVNEHLRFLEKRFQVLQNVINRSHSPELLFYYTMQFLLSTGHTEKAWFLFEANFNFGMTNPKNDAEAEVRQLEFCVKSQEMTLCEAWLRSENIREKTNIRPGPFTWDQERRVDYRFMNSNLRNVHYYSRDRALLYRVSLAALFGRDLFDFDETDAFYNEIELTTINSLQIDLTNKHDLYEKRKINEESMIECLYPVDGITSMYILVLCNENLKSKTKKTGRNLIKASAGTALGASQQNIIMFMYCLLHENCSELMMKSLSSLVLSQEQCNLLLIVLAWAVTFGDKSDANTEEGEDSETMVNLVSNQVINAVYLRSSQNPKMLKIGEVPFPRHMIKSGLNKIFSNPPKLLIRVKSFQDFIAEERHKFHKVNDFLTKNQMSVFQANLQETSRDLILRLLAKLYLVKEKYGKNSREFKHVCKRKLTRLLDNPGRLSLDACRCPLVWKLMLDNVSEEESKNQFIIGQKFVGWSKSYQMAYLNRIKAEKDSQKELISTVFISREYGLRVRTLPEEVAIFLDSFGQR